MVRHGIAQFRTHSGLSPLAGTGLSYKESRVDQGKNAGRKASHVTRCKSAGGTGVDRRIDLY